MSDDALLVSAFRKVLADGWCYVGLSPRDRTDFKLCVDGTAYDLTLEERDAVARLLESLPPDPPRYGSKAAATG